MLFHVLLQTLLLLVTSSALPIDDMLPTSWTLAPSSLADYPWTNECTTSSNATVDKCRLIDPWNYDDRLGLYKMMIDATTPLMPFCSSSNVWNILFGLASQFSWQFDSNRLFSNGTRQVSTSSWWGSANYYLSVIPFLAAVDVGLIEQGPFRIVQRDNFCSTSSQCFAQTPQAMLAWRRFFSNLILAKKCGDIQDDTRAIDQCYLAPMWSAHISSIESALPLIQSKLLLLPSSNEQRFAMSWANLVAFIAMSRKNTNLPETDRYQREFLPQRLLTDADHPPHCLDMSRNVNDALALLFSIRLSWYEPLKVLWKPATCNFEARQDAQRVLETVAVHKFTASAFYLKAVQNSLKYECDLDDQRM